MRHSTTARRHNTVIVSIALAGIAGSQLIHAGPLDLALGTGAEVAVPLEDCTSPDKTLGVVLTIRKQGKTAATWPKLFPTLAPGSTPADSPGYTTSAWVVDFEQKKKLAAVPDYEDGWSANGVRTLWGPNQGGWRFGVLDVDLKRGNREVFVINAEESEAGFIAIRDILDKKVGKVIAEAGLNAADYVIDYSLKDFLNAGDVSSPTDALKIELAYLAENPTDDDATAFDGRLHLDLSRNARGRATAEITEIFPEGGEPPMTAAKADGPHNAPSDKEFGAFRNEWTERSKSGEWTKERVDLPDGESGSKRFVSGWLDANVLQRLLYVDSLGDDNETITLFYWRDGLLTSVFELRKGAATQISDVGQATETYNFAGEELVSWKRTGDGDVQVDPSDPSFSDRGEEVFQQSLDLAAPIYKKIGAD